MRKFTDLIKAIAIIALIAILIGAVAKLFVPSEDVETPTPDESIVETLPDSSKPDVSEPEESEPDVSEPEVSDEVYLDVVLASDLEAYKDTLSVKTLPDGITVNINGYTSASYTDASRRPWVWLLDLTELYEEYGEGYYVISYEVVSQGNDYEFKIMDSFEESISETPTVHFIHQNICLVGFEVIDPDLVGVIDLNIRFKAMYVSQEYIETANLG